MIDRTQFADEGEDFSGWEFLFPLVKPRNSSVFDFLTDCVFVIRRACNDRTNACDILRKLSKNISTQITEAGEIGLEPNELFLTGEELREKFDSKQTNRTPRARKNRRANRRRISSFGNRSSKFRVKVQSLKTNSIRNRFFFSRPLKNQPNLRSVRVRRASFTETSKTSPTN